MKKLVFLFVTLLVSTLGFAQMEQMMQPLPLDPAVRYGKLPNGLTYYVRHNEHPRGQANFYIAQKVGSVLEEDDQRGLAHFLEHMCFNGTKNFPENQVIRYLETIGVKFGAQLNAYTSVDQTVYNINNVPTAREATIDSVLLILHDWSHDLTLDPKEIDKERGVIHEEWRLRSSATMRIFERQLPKLMSNSRPGNRLPIGTMEVVDNFKPEVLRAYYEKWYRPDQQAIIVVGDLDVDRTEQQIKDMFSPIEMPANAAEREYYGVPDNEEPIVVSDHDKEQTMPIVMICNKHEDLMPRENKNTMPYLFVAYARNMMTAMLNLRLEELSLDPDVPFLQAGVADDDFLLSKVTKGFQTTIIPKEGRLEEAVTKVMAEVYRAARFGFTGTEYNRARTEFLSQLEAQYNNRETAETSGYIDECVNNFLDNIPMPGIEMKYNIFNSVAPQIPVDVVNQLLAQLVSVSDTNLVILNMNPEKEGYVQPTEEQLLAAVHSAQKMDLAPYVDNVKNEPLIPVLPKKGKIKKEEAGKFGSTILTLSNGVKVILKKTDFKDNEIVMHAYSDGGTGRYGVEDKYTLAMQSSLIDASGLGEFTSTELQKALAGVQASVSTGFSNRSEYLSGNAVPKDLRSMFELIYLHFKDLKRDEKAVASVMAQTAQALRNQSLNPMKAFSDSLQTALYGNNPRLVLLKEEDLAKVSYDRALEIYKDRFADASDFTFVFVGNFDNDSIRAYSAQYLATLPVVKRNDAPVDNHYDIQSGLHFTKFAKKQEQPKCQLVMISNASVENTLKNQIVSDMLGEVLNMRLLETIREEMGAAYSVGSSAGVSMKSDGTYRVTLQIYAPVKPEMLDSSLLVIKQELQNVSVNGADEKYTSKVKEYMQKTYKEKERENSTWAGYFESYYRQGVDEYTDFEKVLQAVTSDDLSQMAKHILSSGNEITVIMTPES